MSSLIKKIACSFGALFLLVLVSWKYSNSKLVSSEKSSQPNFSRSSISYSGIGQRNLGLKFKLYGSDSRIIVATVQLPENLELSNQKLKFKWQLDENVILKNYDASGEILIPSNKKSIDIPIEVNNFSQTKSRFVRFEARIEANTNRFFTDGIISSQEQSSFEAFVRGIEDFKKRGNLND